MKILIRDENESGFRAVPIKIKIEGGSSYNIDVQMHREDGAPEPQVEVIETTDTIPGTEEPPVNQEATTHDTTTEETALDETQAEELLPEDQPVRQPSEVTTTATDAPKAKKAKRKPGAPGVTKTIEIKITLPPLPKQLPTRREIVQKLRETSRRRLIAAGSIATALLIIAIGTQVLTGSNATGNVAGAKRPELQRGTPTYSTVLPAGKTIKQLGGWVRISPPDRDPVYTYVDRIGPTQINVSEQPLPKAFKADLPTRMGELAQNYNATEKVTAGSTTVYIGTDEKGPQSVILAKNDLLILIKSADTVSPTDWVSYVNSLQ